MSVWRRQRERQLKQCERQTEIEREKGGENETKRQHVTLHENPNHQSCFMMSQNRVHNVYNYNQVWQAHTRASFRGVLFSSLRFFSCSLIYHYSSPRIYWTDINLVSFYEYVHNIPTKCLLKLCGLSQISCGEQIEKTESTWIRAIWRLHNSFIIDCRLMEIPQYRRNLICSSVWSG